MAACVAELDVAVVLGCVARAVVTLPSVEVS